MDQIRQNCNNKHANATTPHILNVLEKHEERILKIEALIATRTETTKETTKENISFEDEIKIIEKEINEPEIIEPEIKNPLILELTNKISDLSNQAVVLNDELNTLEQIEEDELNLSISDTDTICTDICRELLQDAEISQIGTWKCEKEMCKGCIKTNAKAYAKEKKKREKERAKELKIIKQKQKDLIKIEQKNLSIRLKNIKKNRPEDYGLDKDNKQEELRKELKRLSEDYEKGKINNSNFKIQLYI